MSKIKMLKGGVQICTGRLVGFINTEECRAIMNSPEAGKKIFTSADISMDSITSDCYSKRFVIATSDYGNTTRKIFISPTIRYMSYMGNYKSFKCEDDNDYVIRKAI